eukprot:gene11373-23806_t
MHRFSLIGAPGVGKGTFGKVICQRLNLEHISIGNLIRMEIERKSELGAIIQSFNDKGALVPDDIVCDIVYKKYLYHINQSTGFILDGFPRNLFQSKFITSNNICNQVIHIKLNKSIAIEKILARRICTNCSSEFNIAHIVRDGYNMPAILPIPSACPLGPTRCNPQLISRTDDTEISIRTRFQIFENETEPILKYFNNANILKTFEVHRGIEDVENLLNLITQM